MPELLCRGGEALTDADEEKEGGGGGGGDDGGDFLSVFPNDPDFDLKDGTSDLEV